ncbi:phage integrase family protein [Modicisalibacter xianhensis]|uniref:Phage integrase family protein n=1 Tax=Modicisalibacter xianhensis TaxID=442341 RepID=A0A4R8F7U9_9GAMM|nr:site-specific integrase [Halomonas xianhensis]TDX21654.1 phage integrase family protein [Halomonas xianhensis]
MLTDKQVKALKPRDRDYTLSDDTRTRGQGRLTIRVRPSGTKTWEYRYFKDGKRCKKSLGNYPTVPLVKAREAASGLAARLADTGTVAEPGEDTGTLSELMAAYIQNLRDRGKDGSADEVEAMCQTYIVEYRPDLWAKRADLVTPGDVSDLLREHIERGVTTATNRLRSWLNTAYNFGLKAHYNPRARGGRSWGLQQNPCALVPRQSDYERKGKRVLTEEEVRDVWVKIARTARVGPNMAAAIRLCFATGGQRLTGLLRLEPHMVDFATGLITQPPEITKTAVAHVIPMSRQAREILEPLHAQALDRGTKYLFPSGQFSDGHVKPNSVGVAIREYRAQFRPDKPAWSVRDIRRTVKTELGKEGVSKEDRDRLQGHAMQDISSRHYDRYDYLEEKRQAMKVWEAWLDRVIS